MPTPSADWDLSDLIDEIQDPLDLFDEDVDLGDDDAALAAIDDEVNDVLLPDDLDRDAQGRVAMAARVRRVFNGSASECDLEKVSYGKGFFDGLRAAGVDARAAQDSFGALGAMLGAAAVKAAVPIVSSRLQQRAEAGEPLFPVLRSALAPALSSSPVAADATTLPPVYVEDAEGAEESAVLAEPHELGPGQVVDQFGATARYGFVQRQPRAMARSAATRAVERGAAHVQSARPRKAAPFLEDPLAAPVLHADGSIHEPVYGVLECVPCPSCARVRMGALNRAPGCGICSDYGAILVPRDDVGALCGARYGVVGATLAVLGALGAAGGGAWALMPEEKRKAVLEKVRAKRKALGRRLAEEDGEAQARPSSKKKPDPSSELESGSDVSPDASEEKDDIESDLEAMEGSFGAVRALMPCTRRR